MNGAINAVFLYDGKIIIYYNIREGKQISYLEMLENMDELAEAENNAGATAPADSAENNSPGVSGFQRGTCSSDFDIRTARRRIALRRSAADRT